MCVYTRWLKKLPLLTGVEQAMKNWKGEKFRTWSARKMFAAAPLYSSLPPATHWGHMPFLLSSWGHACCDHNDSESYSTTIYMHCVDQQTDSLVFTEFQSDHRAWSHWKVGRQRPILALLHRNLEGHSPSLPYSLFRPWLLIGSTVVLSTVVLS